jgi:hypothetical protein
MLSSFSGKTDSPFLVPSLSSFDLFSRFLPYLGNLFEISGPEISYFIANRNKGLSANRLTF